MTLLNRRVQFAVDDAVSVRVGGDWWRPGRVRGVKHQDRHSKFFVSYSTALAEIWTGWFNAEDLVARPVYATEKETK